jgi:hypothetical protein
MDRVNSRISQAYGYSVCFITVIVMLIAIKAVVDAAFDLSDPLRAESSGRPLTNFDLYKEARKQPAAIARDQSAPTPVSGAPTKVSDTRSDAELRKLYDAERNEAIGSARFHAIRSLVGNVLLITLAGVLFGIHWRWLKRRDGLPAPV